jgi:hypothetical protein
LTKTSSILAVLDILYRGEVGLAPLYLPRMFLPRSIYLEIKPDLPKKFLPRKYLPRKYLPRKYLPRKYLPRMFLPGKYLPRMFLPRKMQF